MYANVHLSREVNVIQSAIVPSKKIFYFREHLLVDLYYLSINFSKFISKCRFFKIIFKSFFSFEM